MLVHCGKWKFIRVVFEGTHFEICCLFCLFRCLVFIFSHSSSSNAPFLILSVNSANVSESVPLSICTPKKLHTRMRLFVHMVWIGDRLGWVGLCEHCSHRQQQLVATVAPCWRCNVWCVSVCVLFLFFVCLSSIRHHVFVFWCAGTGRRSTERPNKKSMNFFFWLPLLFRRSVLAFRMSTRVCVYACARERVRVHNERGFL